MHGWCAGRRTGVTVAGSVGTFGPDPAGVRQARRFLRAVLRDLGSGQVGPGLAELLLMAANELTTNAVLHARTEFTVRVLVDPVLIRVEVSDENPRLPRLCLVPADATSGRGLAVIDGSGLEWGVDRYPGGKTVWVTAHR